MLTDHQGTIVALVDTLGVTRYRACFDAWGNRTSVVDNTGISLYFQRGYTGHEMLPEFGLINMNGRMYDPLLGRFLSPDRYVQLPDNSQNFNRYSYCLNNPLKYTDPSGELLGIDDAAIAIIAAVVISGAANVAINWNQIESFGHGVTSFFVGCASALVSIYGSPILGAMVSGAGNSFVNQVYTKGWSGINVEEILMSTGMSLFSYGSSRVLGGIIDKPLNSLTSNITNQFLREGVKDFSCGFIGGFTMGAGFSLVNGYSSDALEEGLKMGVMTGTVSALNSLNRSNYYHKLAKIAESTEGYKTFSEFKKVYGKAGEGMNWHHIVEQTPSNIEKFGPEKIHNINNLVKIPGGKGSIHAKISAHYSSKPYNLDGLTVRQWLSSHSYDFQYKYGLYMLNVYNK